jgi:hypothetical protein
MFSLNPGTSSRRQTACLDGGCDIAGQFFGANQGATDAGYFEFSSGHLAGGLLPSFGGRKLPFMTRQHSSKDRRCTFLRLRMDAP